MSKSATEIKFGVGIGIGIVLPVAWHPFFDTENDTDADNLRLEVRAK